MNNWAWLHVASIAVAFAQGCFFPSSLGETSIGTIHWQIAGVLFFFPIVGLLFVIGIQFVNPYAAPTWQYPTWTSSPFTVNQPLQFFHLAGPLCLASGLGVLVSALVRGASIFDAVAFILLGLGTIVGVYVCTIVYRRKMAHDA